MDRKICVIAGAGAGKTRAAIEYVKKNVAKRILVLAFSNIAVQTFRERCSHTEAEIRTIDSMALKILKKKKGMYLDVIDRLSEPSKFKEYAKKFDLNQIDIQHRTLNGLNEEYAKLLASDGYIDYGIIMQKVMMLPDITQDYDIIIIDEFQDINDIQWAFIEKIRGVADLFVVGDPRQNIYSWRGANSSIFQEFTENAEIRELNFNYRSYQEILDVANVYSYQIDPSLSPLISKRGYGGSVKFISEREMVKYVQNCDINSTAIVTYTRDGVSAIIAQLTKNNIQYKSSYSLYRRANIKPTIAVIKAMIEFNRTLRINDVLLKTLLLKLPSIGKETVKKLTYFYNEGSLFENLIEFYFHKGDNLNITDKAKKSLTDFLQCLSSYCDLSDDSSECQYKEPGCNDEECKGCPYLTDNTPVPVKNLVAICDQIGIEKDIFFEQFILEINDALNQSFNDSITTLDNFLTDIESKKKQLENNTQGVFVSTIHGIKGEDKYETVFFKADDFGKQKRGDVLKMSYVGVTRARKKLFIVGKDTYFDKELYDSFESLKQRVIEATENFIEDDQAIPDTGKIFINPITGNILPLSV